MSIISFYLVYFNYNKNYHVKIQYNIINYYKKHKIFNHQNIILNFLFYIKFLIIYSHYQSYF